MDANTSQPNPLHLTPTQTAWLAGLIEGEGCFTYERGAPVVEIQMSDLDVVERAAFLMRGSVYAIPQSEKTKALGRLQMYRVRLRGVSAVHVMLAVLPHLGERRTARATEIILDWLPTRMSHLIPRSHISSSNTTSRSAA